MSLCKIAMGAIILSFISCDFNQSHEILEFNPAFNFSENPHGILDLPMDLTNALTEGIMVPGNKNKDDYFELHFKVEDVRHQKLYYKIYYQNESYKNNEVITGKKGGKIYNIAASENFYGSWKDTEIGFKEINAQKNHEPYIEVVDSFQIVGNPRNEKIYFGASKDELRVTKDRLAGMIGQITRNKEWSNSIREKAIKSNYTYEEQLEKDALWMLKDLRNKGEENHRWKRNPRVGKYKFLLVVLTEEELQQIPDHIKYIHLKDPQSNQFIDPFYFYNNLPDSIHIVEEHIVESTLRLNLSAKLDVKTGIYDSEVSLSESDCSTPHCNNTEPAFHTSHFEVYHHSVGGYEKFHNIPVVADVINGPYNRDQYEKNKVKYDSTARIHDYIRNSICNCQDVGFDSLENALFLKNRKSTPTHLVKQNIGLKTRIGFTYGKITAKIKFPKLINTENVWNGITCACWLLYQDDNVWNKRNICNGEKAYLPRGAGNDDYQRVAQHQYSEIDIEIVKTSKNWPIGSYAEPPFPKDDDPANNHNLTITCSNWDLSCEEPSGFASGVSRIGYKGETFELHRWDHWYKALTSKYEYEHDLTVGDEILYQIDWQPDRIIWRVGKDENNMKVVGYMDSTVTKIPNNQMIMVVTQEWHLSNWWHMAPFKQDHIPFPKEDIVGYLYSVEVE